jgi:hypothetical protein
MLIPKLSVVLSKLDSKNRFTLREPSHSYYHVLEFEDGTIVLKPRILVDPELLSPNVLKMIDDSVKNLKNGKVSKEVNLEKYLKLASNLDEV